MVLLYISMYGIRKNKSLLDPHSKSKIEMFFFETIEMILASARFLASAIHRLLQTAFALTLRDRMSPAKYILHESALSQNLGGA